MRDYQILSWILLLSILSINGQLLGGSCEDPDNCAQHGKCMNGTQPGSFWCRCDNGYGGDFCERECHLQCDDDMKCVFDDDGKNPTCMCKDCINEVYINSKVSCPPGFGGPDCTVRYTIEVTTSEDPCRNNPCHNGKCYPFSKGFQCICDNGFGGSYCEEGTDHCRNHNCTRGSQCINTEKDYYCACPPGKFGAYCENTNCALLGNVCNGGTCLDIPTRGKPFTCVCPDGYEGEFCTQDKDECISKDNICLNNGTCTNLVGGFFCSCKLGFTGKFCSQLVDTCKEHQCSNGGECGTLPDRTPVCTCKQGFAGPRCDYVCPPGYGGYQCTLPLREPHCSRARGGCYNGGICNGGFCKCPPAFSGDRCEIQRPLTEYDAFSSCKYNPCMNNSTCVDVDNGYSCICPPGFYGMDCERQIACASTTCANGGRCSIEKEGMMCHCPPGYYGEYCEKKEHFHCRTNSCLNNGVCREYGNYGICDCKYGFTGTRCQDRVKIDESKEFLNKDLCLQRNCSSLAANGVCDHGCNMKECDFDGGDCSGGQKPFSKCFYPSMCADLFANGICNQECNTEGCLYDGLDCQSELYRCPARIRQHCIERRGNGICDWECSFIGCGFDGGDCNNGTEAMILSDIRIKVQIDPSLFQLTGGETLMDISTHLRATVRIQKDDLGPLVFKWDGEKETERIEMDSKKLARQQVLSKHTRQYRSADVTGIVLYLEVEEICQPKDKCRFSTAQSVVDLIAAGLIKSDGRISLGLPITEAIVAAPRKIGGGSGDGLGGLSRNQIIIIVAIAFFAFGSVVAGVIVKTGEPERSRKRKMIHAPVWMPPMDPSTEKNTSNNSSQCSLLDNSAYLHGGKRYRGEFVTTFDGHYHQIYPTTLANGYTGEFGGTHNYHQQQQMTNIPYQQEPVKPMNVPADQIPLHVEAASRNPIQSPISFETVNQVDSNYRRSVLHWLAGNTAKKPDTVIASETVKCLDAGADVNARDCDENTPLMLAVKSRRVRLAVILLRAGANPTIFNSSERSALHEAVANQDCRMIEILLAVPLMCQEIDELDRNGMTALMNTARTLGREQVKIAKFLLDKGAKIDEDGGSRKDSEKYHGRTALHFAALVDNVEMVAFLVSQNSNMDKQDEAGRTPIMLAAKEGHEKTVKYLIDNGASLSIVDALDKSVVQYAKENYHHKMAEYIQMMAMNKNRSEVVSRQQITNNRAGGRQTMKAVKRAGSRKTPLSSAVPSSASSRESNHLTPPPSDGSFSSPSPHYFQTTTSTPTGAESSPEYAYNPELTNMTPMWYPSPTSFHNQQNANLLHHHLPPQPHDHHLPSKNPDGSFYC